MDSVWGKSPEYISGIYKRFNEVTIYECIEKSVGEKNLNARNDLQKDLKASVIRLRAYFFCVATSTVCSRSSIENGF